jgi:uncharacterized membrane protein
MNSKSIFISEALKIGWRALKEHFLFFVSILILGGLTALIPFGIASYLSEQSQGLSFLFWLIYYVLAILVQIGYVRISLDIVDKNKAQVTDLWTGIKLFFSYLIANILYALILLAGLILLVFPMFIWQARYGFFPYALVDKKLGPIKALEASAKLTYGAKWEIFAYFLISYLLIGLGALLLGIGLFATLPIVMVSSAWIYRRLEKQTELQERKI